MFLNIVFCIVNSLFNTFYFLSCSNWGKKIIDYSVAIIKTFKFCINSLL